MTIYKFINNYYLSMKKIIMFLLLAVITVGMSAVFTSCGSDDDDSNTLIGTKWEYAKNSDLYTFEFNSDTTCRLTKQEKQLDSNFDWINVTSYVQYRYLQEGNIVTLTPVDDSFLVPLRATINGNTMTVVNTSNNSVIYTCTKVK